MIHIYEGRIGGGKTYNCVRRALEYAANGGTVAGNLFMKVDKCVEYCRKIHGAVVQPDQFMTLTLDQLYFFHAHVPQGTKDCPTLVFVDEAQIPFGCNDYRKTDGELLEFLTQSRRAFIDVIFVTQHADNINKMFRKLTSSYHVFKDMQKAKIAGLPIKYPFRHFRETVLDIDRKTILDTSLIYKDPDIFACYDSYGWQRPLPLLAAKGKTAVGRAKGRRWPVAALWCIALGLTVAGCMRQEKADLAAATKAVERMAQDVSLTQVSLRSNLSTIASAGVGASKPADDRRAASPGGLESGRAYCRASVRMAGAWRHVLTDGTVVSLGAELPGGESVVAVDESGFWLNLGKGLYRRVLVVAPPPEETKGQPGRAIIDALPGGAYTTRMASDF